MIDPPQITVREAQKTAVIRLIVPKAEIRKVMGPAMQEVREVVAAQGIKPDGAIFAHHFRMDPRIWDFEVGLPVPVEIESSERVTAGKITGSRVVRTNYYGGYEELRNGWREFERWIDSRNLATGMDLWETYLRGPVDDPDSESWCTELLRPVLGDE